MQDKEYTKAIEKIWQKYQPSGTELAQLQPLCYVDIPESSLLIIGLNPSINRKTNREVFRGKCKPEEVSNFRIQETEEKNNYHKALRTFTNQVKSFLPKSELSWGHIDLFLFRKTSSKFVKQQEKKNNEFFKEQIELTRKLVESRKPKVILVANAYATKLIFKYWMNNNEELFDSEIGTYRYNGTPIFFSGMLSGQRALDLGNRKRLAWQINNCL